MARLETLAEAIRRHVRDGSIVALEGFTHLIPFAAGQEIIRQGFQQLTLIRMTPDLIYDQLIGMGCAKKLIFSWGGNAGVGSLYRFRDAVENGWPNPLEIEEHSHAAMANAFDAGAAGMPLAVFRGYIGTDYPRHNPNIKWIDCPFTGESLAAVPALTPDVAVIHAQQADHQGNVRISGIVGAQRQAVLAAKKAIVTVEEIVDDLAADLPNTVILPSFVVDSVCEVPRGAHPSYAQGYYERHNAFYRRWDQISRDRETFLDWMGKFVLGVGDWQATWSLMREEGYV